MAALSMFHQSILSLTCILVLHQAKSLSAKVCKLTLADLAEYLEYLKLQIPGLCLQGDHDQDHLDHAVRQDMRNKLAYFVSIFSHILAVFCLPHMVKAVRSELPQDMWSLLGPASLLLTCIVMQKFPEKVISWFFAGMVMRDLLMLYLAPDASLAVTLCTQVQAGYLCLTAFALCHNAFALLCWQIVLSLVMWHRCSELIALEPHQSREDWVFHFMVGRLRAAVIVTVGAHIVHSFLKANLMASFQSHEAAQAKVTIETLLSSVCDAVVYLRSDFAIVNPAPKLAALVRSDGLLQGRLVTDFMPDDDSRRYRDHAANFEEFGHALSLNLRLLESGGGFVAVKVVHIPFEDVLTGHRKYLIGLTELEPTGTLPDLAVPPSSMLGLQDSQLSEHMAGQHLEEYAKDEDVISFSLSFTTTDRKSLEQRCKRACEVATQVDFAAFPGPTGIAHKAVQTDIIAATLADSERILPSASPLVGHRLEGRPPRLPVEPSQGIALPRRRRNTPKEHKRLFTMFELTPPQTVNALLHEVVGNINVVARAGCCTYHSGMYYLQQQCKQILTTASCRELGHQHLVQCSDCLKLQTRDDEEFICDLCFGEETRPLHGVQCQELSSGVEADNSSNAQSEQETCALPLESFTPISSDNVLACGPPMIAHTPHATAIITMRSNIVNESSLLRSLRCRGSTVDVTGANRSSKGPLSIGDEIDIFSKFLSQPPQEVLSKSFDPDALRSEFSRLSKKFNESVRNIISQAQRQVGMRNAELPTKYRLSKHEEPPGVEVDALIDFLQNPSEEQLKNRHDSKTLRSVHRGISRQFSEVVKGIVTRTRGKLAIVLETHTILLQDV